MFSLGAPFGAPTFQQFRAHLVLAGNLAASGTRIQGAHGSNFQVATVYSSGQIHFLTPFNVFVPLTSCRTFRVHSRLSPSSPSPPFFAVHPEIGGVCREGTATGVAAA